jgi:hypothetical protein
MSFPSYNISSVSGPGILYVHSKIKDKTLTAETFTKWYQDVHIPDIFETGGITSAFRYYSTSGEAAERPYLALYPMKDVAFLQSDKFRSIPVHSRVLPGTTAIFDYADFDTRYYLHLNTVTTGTGGKGMSRRSFPTTLRDMLNFKGPAPGILTFNFDLKGGDEEAMTIIKDGRLPIDTASVRQISLYKNYFARQNRNPSDSKTLSEPPKYLVVVELDKPSGPKVGGEESSATNMITATFDLLIASGDSKSIVLN